MSQPKEQKRAAPEPARPEGRSERPAATLAVSDKQKPAPVPDDDVLERVAKANTRLIKQHSDRLIGTVMKDGKPEHWWVRPVKLEKLTKEERKFLE